MIFICIALILILRIILNFEGENSSVLPFVHLVAACQNLERRQM